MYIYMYMYMYMYVYIYTYNIYILCSYVHNWAGGRRPAWRALIPHDPEKCIQHISYPPTSPHLVKGGYAPPLLWHKTIVLCRRREGQSSPTETQKHGLVSQAQGGMCAVPYRRYVCCVTQQTSLLCHTADVLAVRQQKCLLYHSADMAALSHSRLSPQRITTFFGLPRTANVYIYTYVYV